MTKKIKVRFLAIAVLISFAGILSSCYYDYGIDPDSSNVVVTFYDNTYDFQQVQKYALADSVVFLGDGTQNHTYDQTIINTVRTNLNNLNWVEVPASDSTADVVVLLGETSSTVTYIYGDYDWYDYWGWYPYWGWYSANRAGYDGWGWYYPWYGGGYDYSYTFTTGTVIMYMTDPSQGDESSQTLPLVWSGVLNGAAGQTTPTNTLIVNGINQAFSQSPYLKNNN